MSLFKGHKIDYDQAEAEVKLAETDERRKEARTECYKANVEVVLSAFFGFEYNERNL